MNINILCNKGIELDNNTILLGGYISDVLNIIEAEDIIDDCYYFFESNLSITVEDNRISYIEISNDDNYDLNVFIDDIDVFSVERNELINYLTEKNGEDLIHEVGTLSAKNIGISVDEGLSQADIDELIEDAKNEGNIDEMMDSIKGDIKRMEHISCICLFDETK